MKKRMKPLIMALTIILALSMVLSACASQPAPSQPGSSQPANGGSQPPGSSQPATGGSDKEVVITMGLPNSWNHLICYSPPSAYQIEVTTAIFDLLTRINDKGEIEPRAAESWTSSDDLMSLTIKLRNNSYWQDGVPVTSADWKYTLDLMSSKAANQMLSQPKLNCFAGTDISGQLQDGQTLGVEAPDDYTLVLHFKTPTSATSFFMNYAYMLFVLPQHLLSKLDPANIMDWDYWKAPIGSGPCKFVSENNGNEIVLQAVDNYPIGKLQFDKLIYKVVAPDSAVSAFLSGELNGGYYTGLTRDSIKPVQDSTKLRADLLKSVTTFSALCINNDRFDANFRKAVNYAIDKDMICKSLYFGDADPTNSSVVPSSKFAVETWKGRDLDKAKQLLAQSSWKAGGKPISLAVAPGLRTDIAAVIQQNLKDIGIETEITTQDQPSVLKGLSDGTYDMGIFSGSSMAFPTWITNMPIFFQNLSHIKDQSLYFAFRDKASGAKNDDEMMQVAKDFQAFWEDQMPACPLWHAYGWYIFSDWLTNVTPIETSAVWTWQVDKSKM